MNPRVVVRAAGVAVVLGAFSAPLRTAANGSVDAQKQQLEARRTKLDALSGRVGEPTPPPAVANADRQRIDELERSA